MRNKIYIFLVIIILFYTETISIIITKIFFPAQITIIDFLSLLKDKNVKK
jgi:hypothetical protein